MKPSPSGLVAKKLILGTMTFGDTVDETVASAMVDLAIEHGVELIDTANGYAGGKSEEMLGHLLAQRHCDVSIATKVGIPHEDARGAAPLSRRGMRLCLRGSLQRLGVDRVEILYLHQPDRTTPLAETLEAVAEFIAEGLVSSYGVSNYAAWQIADVETSAQSAGLGPPVVAQQLYNLLSRRIEDEYCEFASLRNLHTMVYNPLAGGLLTGRYGFGDIPKAGRFGSSSLADMYRARYWDPQVFDAIAALDRLARSAGLSLVELSLRWLLSREGVGSVILGSSRLEHLAGNFDVLRRGPLDDGLTQACNEATEPLRGVMPPYNR